MFLLVCYIFESGSCSKFNSEHSIFFQTFSIFFSSVSESASSKVSRFSSAIDIPTSFCSPLVSMISVSSSFTDSASPSSSSFSD
jgi:hypothetical protein